LLNDCTWDDNCCDNKLNWDESFSAYDFISPIELFILFNSFIIVWPSFNVLFNSSFNSGIYLPSNKLAAVA